MANRLYHGSTTQGLKILKPARRYTPAGKIAFAAVYATPLPAYAAAHSFPWSSNEGIDVKISDGEDEGISKNKKVTLIVPAALHERLNMPISIYVVAADGFEHTREESTGHTWHATRQTAVLEEMKYTSVKEALETWGGEVKFLF